MIRPLRQRHRVVVCAFGLFLPIAFVAGIAARQRVPVTRSLPAELENKASSFRTVVWTQADLWPDQRIFTSLRRNGGGSVAVELMFRDLSRPDVLVYWASANETTAEGLPKNARLLGALSNRAALPVPTDARGETGRLILYSLADHELVATSNPFRL